MNRTLLPIAIVTVLVAALLGLLLIFAPLSYALLTLGIIGALACFIPISHKPEIGIYALILSYPFGSLYLSDKVANLSIPNVLLVITALAVLGRMVRHRRVLGEVGPVIRFAFILLPIFLIAVIPSILVAPDREIALRYLPTRTGYALTYVLIVILIRDITKIKTALKCLVASAGLASAATLALGFFPGMLPPELMYLSETAEPLIEGLSTARPTGLFAAAAVFNSWVILALPIAVLSSLRTNSFGIPRYLSVVASSVILGALLLNQTRAGWIAGAVVIALLLCWAPLYLRGKRWAAVLRTAALVGIVLLMGIQASRRVEGFIDWFVYGPGRVGSVIERQRQYELAFQAIRSHPWFGLGPFGINVLYLEPSGLHPSLHNIYLEELVFSGLVGFIPYIAFLPLSLYAPFKLMWGSVVQELRLVAGAIVLGSLGALTVYQSYPGAGEKSYWIMLGLCASTSYLLFGATRVKLEPGRYVPKGSGLVKLPNGQGKELSIG